LRNETRGGPDVQVDVFGAWEDRAMTIAIICIAAIALLVVLERRSPDKGMATWPAPRDKYAVDSSLRRIGA
jgi:hypothetical protein